jgi:hypothetical protein
MSRLSKLDKKTLVRVPNDDVFPEEIIRGGFTVYKRIPFIEAEMHYTLGTAVWVSTRTEPARNRYILARIFNFGHYTLAVRVKKDLRRRPEDSLFWISAGLVR